MLKIQRLFFMFIMSCNIGVSFGQSADWLDIRGIIELQAFSNNSPLSWYSGGHGELRYDNGSSPVQ